MLYVYILLLLYSIKKILCFVVDIFGFVNVYNLELSLESTQIKWNYLNKFNMNE